MKPVTHDDIARIIPRRILAQVIEQLKENEKKAKPPLEGDALRLEIQRQKNLLLGGKQNVEVGKNN